MPPGSFVNHRVGRTWLLTEVLAEALERPSFARRCVVREYRPATNLHTPRCRDTASSVTIRIMSFLGEVTSAKERSSDGKFSTGVARHAVTLSGFGASFPREALEPAF